MNDDKAPGSGWDLIERAEEDDTDGNPALATAVVSLVDFLVEKDRWRILDGRILEDLYGGKWVNGDDMLPGVSAYCEAGGDPVKLNFARNAVDFVHTKICSETPAIVATERGGGYQAERQAELLTEYIDQLTDSSELMSLLPRAALSALRTGTAVIKTHGNGGHPGCELVPAEWVHVDAVESRCGDPRSIYERRPVSRRYLLDRWCPQRHEDEEQSTLEAAIIAAPSSRDPLDLNLTSASDSMVDLVDVYEAWALPEDVKDATPGRHVVCLGNFTLLDDDWTIPRFPHAFYGIDPAPIGRGFWAQGLLSQLDESQAEIDFLLAQVSEQIRMSKLRVFIQRGSAVNEDALTDVREGAIVEFDGTIPHFQTPTAVSREALEHIQWLVKELYETAGMSEQGASSQKPSGVNSGRAILFFHDFQTKRFIDLVKRYGDFCVDVIDRLLDRADECHTDVEEESEEAEVKTNDDDRLSWSKVRMDRKAFKVHLETISAVATSYAGRMQRIEQMIAQGQIPEGYWENFLSNPDAWRAEHRAKSQSDHIEWILSCLEDLDEEIPELSDKLDFQLAIEILTGEVLDLIRKKADREIIDRVEDFYDRIVQRQKELTDEAAARQAQMQGAQQTPTAPGLADMQTGGVKPS